MINDNLSYILYKLYNIYYESVNFYINFYFKIQFQCKTFYHFILFENLYNIMIFILYYICILLKHSFCYIYLNVL